MNTEELILKTVEYLRKNKVLEGNPLFENKTTDFVCTDPRGEWEEHYHQPPFWKNVVIDSHEEDFVSIDSRLKKMSFDEVQEKALREIPNSKETVIIEVGSDYGNFGAGYLAVHKPKAKVILISKKWKEGKKPEHLFRAEGKHVLKFERGWEFLNEPNLEHRINGLYRANGIFNVVFFEREIALKDISLLPSIEYVCGKEIYIFGHKSPKTLPFLVGKAYNKLNARYMCVSLSAQERVSGEEFSWEIVRKNLGLTEKEIKGYIKSAIDPREAELCDKYDYNDHGQMRIGVMIKLGIALALAKEVNGTVLRGDNPENRYNKADHYVEATR
ncbi:hypothetical protein HY638_00890 [Candidatus Woesearchaeota archaeon]|nr:hypothetical protein [Candidatus Woesearchaeota archaeon]